MKNIDKLWLIISTVLIFALLLLYLDIKIIKKEHTESNIIYQPANIISTSDADELERLFGE